MKKVAKKDAKILKHAPKSPVGPGVSCKTASGNEYHIIHGPKAGQHTLWQKTSEGYLETAIADSPYELYDLIDWAS